MRTPPRRTVLGLCALLAVSFAVRPCSAGTELSPAEVERLARGELVRHRMAGSGENSTIGGTSFVLIDRPVDKVWQAFEDIRVWPEVFPNTYEAKVTGGKGDLKAVTLKVGVSMFQVNIHGIMTLDRKTYTVKGGLNKKKTNFVNEASTFLRLIPQPGGRTIVTYTFRGKVPFLPLVTALGEGIIKGIENILMKVPTNLKKWAEARP